MEWQVIVALAIAIPVLLLPVAFVWYLNAGAILAELRERRALNAAQKAAQEAGVEQTGKKSD